VVAGVEMKKRLGELLTILKEKLNEKEIMILEERLLTDEPLTLQTIADRFGISRERVRQIEVNLLKKMKKYLEAEMPDIVDFFDGKRMVQKGG
jgi:RNA polymerase sigma-32 factor